MRKRQIGVIERSIGVEEGSTGHDREKDAHWLALKGAA